MTEDDDRNSPRQNAGNKLVYLLIGGGIGAILALLFAPKSGQELRSDIADATRKGIDRSREAAAGSAARAGDYYESAREPARRRAEAVESPTAAALPGDEGFPEP